MGTGETAMFPLFPLCEECFSWIRQEAAIDKIAKILLFRGRSGAVAGRIGPIRGLGRDCFLAKMQIQDYTSCSDCVEQFAGRAPPEAATARRGAAKSYFPSGTVARKGSAFPASLPRAPSPQPYRETPLR